MCRNRKFGDRPQGPRQVRGLSPGFTLVELLVALAIFALMSGLRLSQPHGDARQPRGAAEGIAQVARRGAPRGPPRARRRRRAAAPRLRPIGHAAGSRSPPRSIRPPRPRASPSRARAMRCMENTLSAPQRVAWRLQDNRVERLTWASVDAAPRDEPVATPILESVSAFTFRYLDPQDPRVAPGLEPAGQRRGLARRRRDDAHARQRRAHRAPHGPRRDHETPARGRRHHGAADRRSRGDRRFHHARPAVGDARPDDARLLARASRHVRPGGPRLGARRARAGRSLLEHRPPRRRLGAAASRACRSSARWSRVPSPTSRASSTSTT